MRTNIVLDEQLVSEAQHLTGIATKRGIVEEGLKTLIRLKKQEAVKAWRGKLNWDDDLDISRTDH
ncbi:MAG: type II toxin-antitoxin system VapB family antitoxin [Mariprofundus sp.]|nr:type II toxin-antitoxin system VapB family antitoxin [Mariprofundus sp.]